MRVLKYFVFGVINQDIGVGGSVHPSVVKCGSLSVIYLNIIKKRLFH